MAKRLPFILLLFGLIGVFDAGYLTYEHFSNQIPPCTINPLFGDCGKVLRSDYAVVLGIPVALIGVFHYSLLTIFVTLAVILKKRFAAFVVIVLSVVGFLASLYFVYLQLFIIGAFCLFCMVSALNSTLILLASQSVFAKQRKQLTVRIVGLLYQHLLKRLLFLFNPEFVHHRMTANGELLGKSSVLKSILSYAFVYADPMLKQTVAGIHFNNPIGLAAGFDYEARLTQTLSAIGFGFQSVGTITHHPYGGNPRPLLGRLPKSRSLMVNKGFKNLGARRTIQKLSGLSFAIPVGISIGRTNTRVLTTQQQSIQDIIDSFFLFEKSSATHAYYELNISCPNLFGNVTFYPPKNLQALLREVDKLHLQRPVFIKMPIEKSDKDVLAMLDVIGKHNIAGVIFGNLQKDRNHPSIDTVEVSKFPVGNFSGKPTFERSNELIELTYRHCKNKLVIIGCGGVFTPEDAYIKIKRGATLVQLITGMIYNGPQLASDITLQLPEMLKKDGFTHISQAIGVDVRKK